MAKQYTKVYYDDEGRVLGVATQSTPFVHDPLPGNPGQRLDLQLEMDDEGHVGADLIHAELVVDKGRAKIAIDKPRHERRFTLRRVTDLRGIEVKHR